MAATNPNLEPTGKPPREGQRQPFLVDDVEEFHEFVDHDTRGEPGYVPLPQTAIIPRIEKPHRSPDASE